MDNYLYKYLKYKEKYKKLKKLKRQDTGKTIKPLFIGTNIPPKMKNIHKFKKITICTYNIWTDDKTYTDTYQKARMPYILDELTKYNIDIICLQNVSPLALTYFKEQSVLTKQYYFLDNTTNMQILFRYKPRTITEHNNLIIMEYLNLIIVAIQLHNNETVMSIHKFIEKYESDYKIIVVGNINYNYDNELYEKWYVDTWIYLNQNNVGNTALNQNNAGNTTLNQNNAGNTADTTINKMRWNYSYVKEESRNDIILYKGSKINPLDIHLIGTDPIFVKNREDPIFNKYLEDNKRDKKFVKPTNNYIQYWPSINFGICASFKV